MRVVIYGEGGYDPSKPNNNIVEDYHVQETGSPASATPATIRIALRRLFGISRDQLESVVQNVFSNIANVNDREDAQDLWLFAKTIERNHPLVSAIGSALNLTSAQIDEAFRFADNL